MKLKTRQEVRAEFRRKGITVREWARKHNLSDLVVYQVLAGRNKCFWGESHRCAVLLGIKDGIIVEEKGKEKSNA
ncbi:MAG TPA: DNA-binding protein [Nitrosomonas sp.]|nr:DNA-binding protein [Nitrosomonas sp.]